MNILQAKDEVKRTIEIYMEKNEYGDFRIPYMKQRPIFLIGAPGIGKTAIIEQVAEELDIGLISYSMTHHTRQSAVGLPYIVNRSFDGTEERTTEYTMSEIIASVYSMVENTGKAQGILFLDEINCVSETLSPSILQFLQYKTFGNHRLPGGWIIITAGNPPEYNRSVREFDIATRDRLKYIFIEDDYTAWKPYAYANAIHSSILSFLELNQHGFYSVKITANGSQYATARGWEDLSYAITRYEEKGYPIELPLITQYITDDDIARKYAVFYELYSKYRRTYKTDRILTGKWTKEIMKRAKEAGFDERVAVIEMLYEALNNSFEAVLRNQFTLEKVSKILRSVKERLSDANADISESAELLGIQLEELTEEYTQKEEAHALSREDKKIYLESRAMLYEYMEIMKTAPDSKEGLALVRKHFDGRIKEHSAAMRDKSKGLENAFSFIEKAWVTGREMMYFMTILTAGKNSSSFIALQGSEGYKRHNAKMLVYDAKEELRNQIADDL